MFFIAYDYVKNPRKNGLYEKKQIKLNKCQVELYYQKRKKDIAGLLNLLQANKLGQFWVQPHVETHLELSSETAVLGDVRRLTQVVNIRLLHITFLKDYPYLVTREQFGRLCEKMDGYTIYKFDEGHGYLKGQHAFLSQDGLMQGCIKTSFKDYDDIGNKCNFHLKNTALYVNDLESMIAGMDRVFHMMDEIVKMHT
jgi:hypothetical protein